MSWCPGLSQIAVLINCPIFYWILCYFNICCQSLCLSLVMNATFSFVGVISPHECLSSLEFIFLLLFQELISSDQDLSQSPYAFFMDALVMLLLFLSSDHLLKHSHLSQLQLLMDLYLRYFQHGLHYYFFLTLLM